jgi:hypothetical protein
MVKMVAIFPINQNPQQCTEKFLQSQVITILKQITYKK